MSTVTKAFKVYYKGFRCAEKGGKRSSNPYAQRALIEQWFNGFDDAKDQMRNENKTTD